MNRALSVKKNALPLIPVVSSYNDLHHHFRDDLIQYVPEERGYIFQNVPLTPIYDAVESFFPVFDDVACSVSVADKEGRPPAYVLERWKADFELMQQTGGFLHRQFDRILLRHEPDYTFRYTHVGRFFHTSHPVSVFKELNQFIMFLPSLGDLTPYRSMWRIFDGEAGITGVVDLLLRDGSSRFVFCDWLYSRNIGHEAGGKFELYGSASAAYGLYPLGTVSDTPFSHAAMRMNVLRVILRRYYDIIVDDLRLVVFHSNNVSAHVLPIPLMETEAEALLEAFAARQSG